MIEQFVAGFEQYLTAAPLLAYLAIFLGGILASLTPCVYPIIPIVIAYIGAGSAGSKTRAFLLSIFYVLGMAVVYSALGLLASLTGQIFGRIASHPLTYFIIANLCVFLGLSMLDVFTLPVPGFLKKTGVQKKRSGLFGAFVVGAFSGLVVSPCTAPVLAVALR